MDFVDIPYHASTWIQRTLAKRTVLTWLERAAVLVTTGIGCWVAVVLAQSIWYFVAGPQQSDVNSELLAIDTQPPKPADFSALQSADLFKQSVVVQVVRTEDVVDTTLQLRLKGITLDEEEPSQSTAYITAQSGARTRADVDGHFYRVGDTVGNQAKLQEIQADRVILDRNGRKEQLTFTPIELAEKMRVPTRYRNSDNSTSDVNTPPRAQRHSAVDSWVNDLELEVVRNGASHELRLPQTGLTQRATSAGLLPQDRITEVNGIEVTDYFRGSKNLDLANIRGDIELLIERGDREFKLKLPGLTE